MRAVNNSNEIHARLASTYGFDLESHFPAKTRFELLKAHCRADMDVLDVGCANGLYALPLSRYVRSVTGMDISQDMLDIACEKAAEVKADNVRFVNTEGQGFDFGEQKYDLIFCFAAFLLFPDCKEFLRACQRGLKPGGILILDVLNRHNLSQRYWRKWYATQGHTILNVFTRHEIAAALEHNGLVPEKWIHQGFADQWKYLPVIERVSTRLRAVDKVFHWGPHFDLDYCLSNTWPFSLMTNRWYIVCKKK